MKKNIWVERLGVFDLIALFIETLFVQASVLYDDKKVSRLAAVSITTLQHCGFCKNFHPAALSLNKKNSAGYAINYSMENDLDNCLNAFCDKYIKNETPRFKSAVRLYITMFLTYRATFVTMVEWKPEFRYGADILHLTRHPLNSIILPFYRKRGHVIRESLLPWESIKYALKPCYRVLAIILIKISGVKVLTNIHEPRPSVWVEYTHKNIIDFTFWRSAIDGKKMDIVYYLDRRDGFSPEEETSAIENMHLKWIDLHFGSLVKLSGIGIAQLWDMWSALTAVILGFPCWFRVFRFEFKMWYFLYRPVFERFKVKVLIEHQDSLWIREAQLKALEDAGGIMMGFHWSNIPYYKVNFWSNPYHVYFVWGKIMYEWIEKRGNICRHVLPAGLWLGPSKENVDTICLKDGLTFILAIFDSSVAYNIYQSEGTLAEFYLRILSMLEKNPGWGGVMKSKNRKNIHDLEFLPSGKEIVSRANSLMKERRLVFLDNKLSPVSASAYADISACYGFNSAGVIVGVHGYRAVHWDCSGWIHHSIYRDPEQKIVYQDLEKFEEAIYKASAGDASIGDFSKWRKAVNYFDDDRAGSRVGGFIQSYMDDVIKSGDAIRSLDKTAKKYIKDNNVGDDFFQHSGYWEDEKISAI